MDGMHIEYTVFIATQNMQKVGSNTQPVGICRRLIDFVISLLIRSMNPGSEKAPEELTPTKNGKSSNMSPNKPNGYLDSEIEVEFRHTTSSKRWKQIDELEESIHSPEKDGLVLSHDTAIQHRVFEKEGMTTNHSAADIDHSPYKSHGKKTRGKELTELEPLPLVDDGSYAQVKSEIVIEEIIEEDERNKNKVANLSADEATKSHNQHHETRQRRRFGPLFSIASNINEKSDAYIDSRKKAINRNYTLDPEKP